MRKKNNADIVLGEAVRNSKEEFVLTPEIKSVSIGQDLLKEITKHSKEAIPKEAIGLLDGKMEKPGEIVIRKIFFVTVGVTFICNI